MDPHLLSFMLAQECSHGDHRFQTQRMGKQTPPIDVRSCSHIAKGSGCREVTLITIYSSTCCLGRASQSFLRGQTTSASVFHEPPSIWIHERPQRALGISGDMEGARMILFLELIDKLKDRVTPWLISYLPFNKRKIFTGGILHFFSPAFSPLVQLHLSKIFLHLCLSSNFK